jgi:hypothetical protein
VLEVEIDNKNPKLPHFIVSVVAKQKVGSSASGTGTKYSKRYP